MSMTIDTLDTINQYTYIDYRVFVLGYFLESHYANYYFLYVWRTIMNYRTRWRIKKASISHDDDVSIQLVAIS